MLVLTKDDTLKKKMARFALNGEDPKVVAERRLALTGRVRRQLDFTGYYHHYRYHFILAYFTVQCPCRTCELFICFLLF